MTFSSFRHLQIALVLEKLATRDCGESIFDTVERANKEKWNFLAAKGKSSNTPLFFFFLSPG